MPSFFKSVQPLNDSCCYLRHLRFAIRLPPGYNAALPGESPGTEVTK